MFIRVLTTALLVAVASPGVARDLAIVIGNRDYEDAPQVRDADAPFSAVFALRNAGFEVLSGRDMTSARLNRLTDQAIAQIEDAERIVILLAGHFVEGRRGSFFLPVDADTSSALSLGRSALPMGTVLDLLATKPGGAVLALAGDSEANLDLGLGLDTGYGTLDLPQGVTLVEGTPRSLTAFVEDVVLGNAPSLAVGAARFGDRVEVSGYVSTLHPFLAVGEGPTQNPLALIEEGFWNAVQTIATQEAIDAYLDRYPRGKFRSEALALGEQIRQAPLLAAQGGEQALGLSANDRRALQRSLVLLGYNTRGIDGIFGRGTRSAITEWQKATGYPETGFFNRAQVVDLTSQARARTAQLEAEAEARAAEEARAERGVWRRTQRQDTAEGYQDYLARYPDGQFVAEATDRLQVLRREARRNARAEETQFWDRVTADGSRNAYEQYLINYPRGAFADQAQAEIAAIDQAEVDSVNNEAALAEENGVLGNPILRLLAERRLAELGLEPGRADGVFDDDTRRAIRKFQRDRGLPVTGYVGQSTAVRMLSEGISR